VVGLAADVGSRLFQANALQLEASQRDFEQGPDAYCCRHASGLRLVPFVQIIEAQHHINNLEKQLDHYRDKLAVAEADLDATGEALDNMVRRR
jgi:hypothetical protein